jgi:hypothetical protein
MTAAAPQGFEGRTVYVKAPVRDQIADSGDVTGLVAKVLEDVRTNGDDAVRRYSREFDKADLDRFEVTAAERRAAVDEMEKQTRADTEFAIENVRRFAEAQLGTILPLEVEPLPGLHLGHRVIPIERVGAYVPGGRRLFGGGGLPAAQRPPRDDRGLPPLGRGSHLPHRRRAGDRGDGLRDAERAAGQQDHGSRQRLRERG